METVNTGGGGISGQKGNLTPISGNVIVLPRADRAARPFRDKRKTADVLFSDLSRVMHCIIIHGVGDARIAAAAARSLGVGVRLASAPGAASYGGAAWFAEIIAAVRADFPDVAIEAVLDCGDAPGHAMAALRAGLTSIRFTGSRRVRDKLSSLARQYDAALVELDGPMLDISLSRHPADDCLKWLSGI